MSALRAAAWGTRYDGERAVLADVDFEAAGRQRSRASAGESGSGKSTLGRRCSPGRERRPTRGTVGAGRRRPMQEAYRAPRCASTVAAVSVRQLPVQGERCARTCCWPKPARRATRSCGSALSPLPRWRGSWRRRRRAWTQPVAEAGRQPVGRPAAAPRAWRGRLLLETRPRTCWTRPRRTSMRRASDALVAVVHELARTKTVVVISHRLAAVARAPTASTCWRTAAWRKRGTHGELAGGRRPVCAAVGAAGRAGAPLGGASAPLAVDDLRGSAAGGAVGGFRKAPRAPRPSLRAGPDCPAHGSAAGPEPAPVELAAPLAPVGDAAAGGARAPAGCPGMGLAVRAGRGRASGRPSSSRCSRVYALRRPGGPARSPSAAAHGDRRFVAVCGNGARRPAALRRAAVQPLPGVPACWRSCATACSRRCGAWRPAKLEGRDKGDLVSLVTGRCGACWRCSTRTRCRRPIIALVVSAGMTAFVAPPLSGCWAPAGSGIVRARRAAWCPYAASRASGVARARAAGGTGSGLNAFVLDSLRGLARDAAVRPRGRTARASWTNAWTSLPARKRASRGAALWRCR